MATRKRFLVLSVFAAGALALVMGAILGCPTTTTVSTAPVDIQVGWTFTRQGQPTQCTPGWRVRVAAGTLGAGTFQCTQGSTIFRLQLSETISQNVEFQLLNSPGTNPQELSQTAQCGLTARPAVGGSVGAVIALDSLPGQIPAQSIQCTQQVVQPQFDGGQPGFDAGQPGQDAGGGQCVVNASYNVTITGIPNCDASGNVIVAIVNPNDPAPVPQTVASQPCGTPAPAPQGTFQFGIPTGNWGLAAIYQSNEHPAQNQCNVTQAGVPVTTLTCTPGVPISIEITCPVP